MQAAAEAGLEGICAVRRIACISTHNQSSELGDLPSSFEHVDSLFDEHSRRPCDLGGSSGESECENDCKGATSYLVPFASVEVRQGLPVQEDAV